MDIVKLGGKWLQEARRVRTRLYDHKLSLNQLLARAWAAYKEKEGITFEDGDPVQREDEKR